MIQNEQTQDEQLNSLIESFEQQTIEPTYVDTMISEASTINEQNSLVYLKQLYPDLISLQLTPPFEIVALIRREELVDIDQILGKGAFGSVYEGTNIETQNPCAIKVLQCVDSQKLTEIVDEFDLQFKVVKLDPSRFLNLKVPIYCQDSQQQITRIFAELELGVTSLANYMRVNTISDVMYQQIYHEILKSIVVMHSNNYAHRDIKPQNIIYVKGKGWVLSDFGCSINYTEIEDIYAIAGTKPFNLPEIRQVIKPLSNSLTAMTNLLQNDLYALQITLGLVLYPNININELNHLIDNKQCNDPLINSLYCTKLADLLPLIKTDYQKIQLKEVQANPIVNKQINERMELVKCILQIQVYTNYFHDNSSMIEHLKVKVKQLRNSQDLYIQQQMLMLLAQFVKNDKFILNAEDIIVQKGAADEELSNILNYLFHTYQYEAAVKYTELFHKWNPCLTSKLRLIQALTYCYRLDESKTLLKEIENNQQGQVSINEVILIATFQHRCQLVTFSNDQLRQLLEYMFPNVNKETLTFSVYPIFQSCIDNQQYDYVIENAEKIARIYNDPRFLYYKGLALYNLGKFQECQSYFKQFLTSLEQKLDLTKPAQQLYNTMLKQNINICEVYRCFFEISNVYGYLFDYKKQNEYLVIVVNILETDQIKNQDLRRDAWTNYAQSCLQIGDLQTASIYFTKAVQVCESMVKVVTMTNLLICNASLKLDIREDFKLLMSTLQQLNQFNYQHQQTALQSLCNLCYILCNIDQNLSKQLIKEVYQIVDMDKARADIQIYFSDLYCRLLDEKTELDLFIVQCEKISQLLIENPQTPYDRNAIQINLVNLYSKSKNPKFYDYTIKTIQALKQAKYDGEKIKEFYILVLRYAVTNNLGTLQGLQQEFREFLYKQFGQDYIPKSEEELQLLTE